MSTSEDVENPSNRRISRSYKDALAGSHPKTVANPSKRPRFSNSRYFLTLKTFLSCQCFERTLKLCGILQPHRLGWTSNISIKQTPSIGVGGSETIFRTKTQTSWIPPVTFSAKHFGRWQLFYSCNN